MNGNWFFIVSIVAIVMCASVMKTYLNQRKTEPQADDKMVGTLAQLAALEERVQVLERIVTENRFDLKKEIDSL